MSRVISFPLLTGLLLLLPSVQRIDRVVAIVDGETITRIDLELSCAIEEIAVGRSWEGKCPDLGAALDRRIEQLLLLHAARRIDLEPEGTRSEGVEAEGRRFLADHAIGVERLIAFFGIDREELLSLICDRLEAERFTARRIPRTPYVSAREIAAFIAAHPERFPPGRRLSPEEIEAIRTERAAEKKAEDRRRWIERLRNRAQIQFLDRALRGEGKGDEE